MIIRRLSVQNFRNYSSAEITLDPGVNLLIGNNAQGKTNFLESVVYLSRGSSYRTRKEIDLIQWNKEYARLEADIENARRNINIVYVIFSGPRHRQIMLNGVKQKSSVSGEELKTILFCPEDLQLLRSGSAVRRKFLDNAISQLRPQYQQMISNYQKLYMNKSRVLREYRDNPSMTDLLGVYNQQMAEYGSSIVRYRASYCQKLGMLSEKYHNSCSGGKENLNIKYHTVSTVTDPMAEREQIYEQIMDHQKSHYRAELDSGNCLTGIHKDDFDVMLNERSIKSFGSQGQTRTAAIAIKLSEREISRNDTGEEPVLLLDDVLSELDPARQNFILNEIKTGQVIITCCEQEKITKSGREFIVDQGTIRER